MRSPERLPRGTGQQCAAGTTQPCRGERPDPARVALNGQAGPRPAELAAVTPGNPPSSTSPTVAKPHATFNRANPSASSLVRDEELVILRLLAEGLPINSVAQHVGVSPRTVRRRVRALCDRIGAGCAIQAIVWAARRGLV